MNKVVSSDETGTSFTHINQLFLLYNLIIYVKVIQKF